MFLSMIGYHDVVNLSDTLSHLEEQSNHNDFIRMGFVSPDQTGYFIDTDGEKKFDIDVGEEDFIKKALSGERVVSAIMEDRFSGNSVVCYGVPVIHNGTVIGAVTATRLTSTLSNIISQNIFDGVAYVHLIDHEGNFIIRSSHAVIPKQIHNIFDEGEFTDNVRMSLLANMENNCDSFASFRYNGEAYWATFIPVGINDWQIFCLVPQTFLNHNFHSLFLVFSGVMIADYTVSPNQDYRINCNFGINLIMADRPQATPDAAINGALLALNNIKGNTSNPIAFYDEALIILEVTESVAMSNLEQVKMVIKKLHNIGFSISMDDFGSGYSSLNTLKDLDIAELKLDKDFLSEQSTSERGKLIIESVIHLARALSITTVAEGIENDVQLEFMKSICCDIGQGYYFAKPMPEEEFERTLLNGEDHSHCS